LKTGLLKTREAPWSFEEYWMSVVSFFDVTKSFGTKILFKDSTFSIMKGKKVALFGDNGSGKQHY